MNSGDLNSIISIQTKSESTTSGDVVESWGAAVTVRANVEQIEGDRFFKDNELVDKLIYKIKLFDNAYSDNIKITNGTQVLYPVRPLTKKSGTGFLTEVTIYAAGKR